MAGYGWDFPKLPPDPYIEWCRWANVPVPSWHTYGIMLPFHGALWLVEYKGGGFAPELSRPAAGDTVEVAKEEAYVEPVAPVAVPASPTESRYVA